MDRCVSCVCQRPVAHWSVCEGAHVFLLDGALFTVVRIRDSGSPADHAASLIGAVVTLVTDADQRARPHVRIADDTFPVAWEENEKRE